MAALGRPLRAHFDYVESRVENALAFEYGGYQFIGITIPLIELILERCRNLTRSVGIANLLRLVAGRAEQERVRGGLFMTQLVFVAAHEFGHYVWGHAAPDETGLWNEVAADGRAGSLEDQARECLADAYAVYLTLDFLIDGEQRIQILELLGQASTPEGEADEALLSAFLVSVSAFFFARSSAALDKSCIYSATHPPAAARMNGIIQTAKTWCSKRRPALDAWTTLERLEKIIAAAADVVGWENWRGQVTFLASPDGKEYYERLQIQLSQMQPPSASAQLTT